MVNEDTGEAYNYETAIAKTFTSDFIKEIFTGNDLMGTANGIQSLINENETATNNENDILATSILANNASLLNSNNYQGLMENAGEVFSALYSQNLEELSENIFSEFKEGSKALEDAGESFQNFINSNESLKNTKTIEYSSEDGKYHFYNGEDELGTATAE